MGITIPKGYRYPEPTDEARLIHTRIKDLADDLNVTLVDHDGRLTTAESGIASRGQVAGRYGSYKSYTSHSPNDGVNRTTHIDVNAFYIPTNSLVAHVSLSVAGQAVANAACTWDPLVSFTTGGVAYQGLGATVSHNQGQAALDVGFFSSSFFDVRSYRGNWGSLAVNCANDATSSAWIHQGYLHWAVTLIA